MIKSIRLSAIIPSTNIDETKKFLLSSLDFDEVKMNSDNPHYGITRTANTELHIQHTSEVPNEMSVYLLVESVDEAWNKLKEIEGLKAKPPFVQDYGMKEVHVIIPHTNTLLFIGEDLG